MDNGGKPRLVYVYSQVPVDVKLVDIQTKWPRESSERRLSEYGDKTSAVTCISMLAHPFDPTTGDGVMDTRKVIHIMSVAPMYTVYRGVGDVLLDTFNRFEEWNLADTDTYDLLAEISSTDAPLGNRSKYRRVRVEPVDFLTESAANSVISKDIREKSPTVWYSNSHVVIDQYVYKTGLKRCVGCAAGKMSGRLFEGRPLCKDCHPNDRHVGTTIRTSKVLDLARLEAYKSPGEMTFAKANHIVDEEYVTFVVPEDQPFISGDFDLDQKAIDVFMRCCKTAIYDIETVPVDHTLTRKIPDEVISIQIVGDVGTDTQHLIILTRKLPNCWTEGVKKDTREFMKDVLTDAELASLKNTAGVVPDLTVMHFPRERDVVSAFRQFIVKFRPHFLVSFNGEGFDAKFLQRSSIAAGMKEPLNEALDHLKPGLIRRLNTTSQSGVTTELRKDFTRPDGWMCSGLISDNVLETGFDFFPCTVGVDLYKIEQCSLADACIKRKVDASKLGCVSHTDIPKMYYGGDKRLWQYAVMDPIATKQLLDKDRFQAIEVFPEMESLVGTPWNLSISRKKTQNAVTTQYVQFVSNGFLTPAILRPKRVMTRELVAQLVRYFFKGEFPSLPQAVQMVVDFTNGHCKCNTSFRCMDKQAGLLSTGPVSFQEFKKVVVYHKENNARSGGQYNTVDVCIVCHYLSRRQRCHEEVLSDVEHFGGFIDEFKALFPAKVRDKHAGHLAKFIAYLLQVRTVISDRFECPKFMWKMYARYYKMDPIVPKLKEYVEKRHKAIVKAVGASRGKYSNRRLENGVDVEALVECLCKGGGDIDCCKLEMLPYDSALILYKGDEDTSSDDEGSDEEGEWYEGAGYHCAEVNQRQQVPVEEFKKVKLLDRRPATSRLVKPAAPLTKKGINLTNVIGVFDFRCHYPNSMISINLGKDLHVSQDCVYRCLDYIVRTCRHRTLEAAAEELCSEYVNCCHTRRIDDMNCLKDYVHDREYVRRNFVFFAKNVKSVQNQQFALEIESRVVNKRKANDPSLPPKVRRMNANMSEAKKITRNSRYGLIQSTVDPRFQLTVTGMGRKSIMKITECLRHNMGAREFYGDSVPGYTPLMLRASCDKSKTVFTTFDDMWRQYSSVKDSGCSRWCLRKDGKEELNVRVANVATQTHVGWVRVLRVIRHKTRKRIYRVFTWNSAVDVTDHSLMTSELEQILPKNITVDLTVLGRVAGEKETVRSGFVARQPHSFDAEEEDLPFVLTSDTAYVLGVFLDCGKVDYDDAGSVTSFVLKMGCPQVATKVNSLREGESFKLCKGTVSLSKTRCSGFSISLATTHPVHRVIPKWFASNCFVDKKKVVPAAIINGRRPEVLKAFMRGFVDSADDSVMPGGKYNHPAGCATIEHEITAETIRTVLMKLGYGVRVYDSLKPPSVTVTWRKRDSPIYAEEEGVVKKVQLLRDCYEDYVYDIETGSGTFSAGVGDLILKNTDSCFVYKQGLSLFAMASMTPREMYEALQFDELVDVPFEEFEENIYSAHYPVDQNSPRLVREAAGKVIQRLFELMEKGLSSEYLEVEAEKTLCPMILPSAKKYIAHNCVTGKPLVKGLSLNNKSASAFAKDILTTIYELATDTVDLFEMASSLYHKLGGNILAAINSRSTVDVIKKLSRPMSVNAKG